MNETHKCIIENDLSQTMEIEKELLRLQKDAENNRKAYINSQGALINPNDFYPIYPL